MGWFRHSIQPTLQAETAECGLACLSMIFAWHRHSVTLQALRAQHPSPDAGVNLNKLMQISKHYKFTPRAIRLELEELKDLSLPCVLHWDFSHYVVLEKVSRRKCSIVDPAMGRRQYKKAELGQHFTGIALELSPALDFEIKAPAPPLRLRDFIPSRPQLVSFLSKTIALSAVLQGLALLGPYYIQTVVDDVLLRADTDLLLVLAVGFALVLLIEVLLSALRSWIGTVFGQRLSFELATSVLQRLLSLPLGWFSSRNTGDIASRFSSFEAMRGFLTQGLAFSIIDGVMAVCFVLIMWIYAASLTAVVVTSVALYLALRLVMFNPQREASAEHIAMSAQQSSVFLESIKHINSLKSYGGENTRTLMWEKSYSREVNCALRLARITLTFSQCQAIIFGAENILVIYLGATLIIDGQQDELASQTLSIGMLYAFIAYKNQFKDRVAGLVNYLIDFKLLRVHMERLSDIVLAEPEKLGLSAPLPGISESAHHFMVSDLSYAYPDRPPLLENIGFSLEPGASLAIGGPSGCGKSTLLKLIASLIPLQGGNVQLKGRSIKDCPLPVWRSMITSVTQEDGLLAGSIADNISMFDHDPINPVTSQKLSRVCELTGLLPMLDMLPLKWDTQLGELGIALSAGQQQRVLIARALYTEPELLILDEATAHLDEASEKRIFQALQRLRVSCLIVSHKASVHGFADYSLTLAPEV